MQLERHALSKLWPDMSDAQFEELKEDIRKHGQRHSITVYGGKVIDGWHRYRACTDLRIKPKTEKFSGTPQGAAELVNSLNAHRRNVIESVRAFAVTGAYTWAESCNDGGGVSRDTPPSDVKTNSEMAALAGTSETTIHRAKRVHKAGSAALKEAVRTGEVPLKKAAAVVNLPKSEQLAAATAKPERADDDDEGDEAELAKIEAIEKEYSRSMEKVMAADDKLAAAHLEIKRQAAEIAALKISRDGFMNGKTEITRLLGKEQNKNERLIKEVDRLTRENQQLKQRAA